MTLPVSNDLSFNAINVELGRTATAQLSIGDTDVRSTFGQASGAVDLNTGHGKSFGLIMTPGSWNINPDRVEYGYSVYQGASGGGLSPLSSSQWDGSISYLVTSDVDGNGAAQYTAMLFSQAQSWSGNYLITDQATNKQITLTKATGYNIWQSSGNGYDNSQFFAGWTATGPGYPRRVTVKRA
jgi:hypothetical protein